MNYESKNVDVGGWIVKLVNDEDGHLSVYLSHRDRTKIYDCQSDIGDENEWAERFTTDKIETEFQEGWQIFVENNSNFKKIQE